ncbi:hypothetical protein ONZ45_g19715 [Pleurotus djamor]|nr:hypothetical protein ONZ45_g19715 [Pleurotus djamor]
MIGNGRGDGVSESDDKSQDIASMLKSISQTINNLPTHTEGDGMPRTFGQRVQEEKWEEEKERMLELGRQAGDTMADISEATLDSVLSTVEALKSKLTMHRIQREEQRKRLEQQMEEEKKKPMRWV